MNSIFLMLLQAIVALGLLNVWLLRFNMSTEYRGGEAKTLVEEFAVYGLPQWFCYFVGILKVSAAVGLLVGFLYPTLILPSSGLIVVLMIGAVSMHLKVGDPIRKAIPAAAMLLMSTLVFGVACYA